MQVVCIFFHICHLQKIWFLISQGSVATCLRWDRYCRMSFIANFIRFPAVHKLWKSVKIWQSYRQLKGGNIFETQCSNAGNWWYSWRIAERNIGLIFVHAWILHAVWLPVFGRPFLKRFALCHRAVICPVCTVCLQRWCIVAKRLYASRWSLARR